MRKSLEQYVDEYRALAKKKREVFRKIEKLVKGKRMTLLDTSRNQHIKRNRSLIASQPILAGDDDEGRVTIRWPAERNGRRCYWRELSDVIIDEDPLVELIK